MKSNFIEFFEPQQLFEEICEIQKKLDKNISLTEDELKNISIFWLGMSYEKDIISKLQECTKKENPENEQSEMV
jgi:hypothetical protein